VANTSGWRIKGDGNAEFNDVTVRGSVFVTGGDAATQTYANNAAASALSDAEDYADLEAESARNAARNNIAQQLGYTDYNTMLSTVGTDGTIIASGFIRTTLLDVDEIFATNATITSTLEIGTGGVIKLEESSINKYGIGKNGVALTSAISSSTGNARLEFRDDPVLASTGLNSGGNPTRLYLEAISPIGPGQAELWSGYNFAFKGASGVVFNFENKVASSVAADSDNDLMRRTDSDTRYARLGSANTFTANQTITGSLILGTQTNKATISYITNTARTYTIPDVSASNFVMSEGDQTINGSKTFGSAITSPSLIVGSESAKATIAYTTNTARTYTIPNVSASDFVMTAGTQTINGEKTFSYNNFKLLNNAATFSANVRYNGTASRNISFPDNGGTVAIIEAGQTYTGNNEFDGQTTFDNKFIKWSNRASVADAGSDYGRLYVDSDGYVRVLLPPP
jgi:hypothetical protein